MIYLFVHQNFPGQYRHIVKHLAKNPKNTVYFITQPNNNEIPGVHKIKYTVAHEKAPNCHPLTTDIDAAIRTGAAVADVCRMLKSQRIEPDLIVGHCGWGETLFIKDVFPDSPLIADFEFYYHATGTDLDFDPEFSSIFSDPSKLRTRNAVSLMAFQSADWGHTPTKWQHQLHPPEMRKRISILHEGVDTTVVKPNPKATLKVQGLKKPLTTKDEVVTYVARNLEPYRGFHVFMRALPAVLRERPNARVLIVGGDGVSYGAAAAPRTTYRQMMLQELGEQLDLTRVHFLGQVEYGTYLSILQISSVHVYLTYPFILSWSFIEAMAAGCLIVGSKTRPVMEVLKDHTNGLAVDFFNIDQISSLIIEALRDQTKHESLRKAARTIACKEYDLKQVIIPKWQRLFENCT